MQITAPHIKITKDILKKMFENTIEGLRDIRDIDKMSEFNTRGITYKNEKGVSEYTRELVKFNLLNNGITSDYSDHFPIGNCTLLLEYGPSDKAEKARESLIDHLISKLTTSIDAVLEGYYADWQMNPFFYMICLPSYDYCSCDDCSDNRGFFGRLVFC
jgi:hypothetical protein